MTTESVNSRTRTSIPALTRGRLALILILLVVCAYANSLSNGLLWDDDLLVSDNTQIRNAGYATTAFTTDLFHHYDVPVATHYRPMQTLSFMPDYVIWGLNPFGYHLTNLFLHLACALLLAVLLVKISGERWIGLLGAALFAVHPVNTNAVTYVSGRADPLAFCFMLLALISYLHYRENPAHRPVLFTVSILVYVAALFSRESALIFPLLIAVLVFTTTRRLRDAALAALPYTIVAFTFAFWRHAVLTLQDKPMESGYSPAVLERVVVFFRSIATYIGLLVWPAHLQMDRQLLAGSHQWLTWLGVVLFLLLIAAIIWAWRHSPVTLFGLLWFVVALAPMIGLLNLNAPVAEHWLYVPAVGLFTALAAVLTKGRQPNTAILVLCIVALTALTFRTARRNQDWATPLTLFSATKQAAPLNAGVRSNLGQEFRARGDSQRALTEFENAEQLGNSDIRLKSNLAALYQATGDLTKARAKVDECLQLQPRNPVVLLRAAAIADDQTDSRSAERYYVLALGTTTDTRAWLQYATFLLKHKRYRDALDIIDTCRYLDPHDANTFNLLGVVHAEQRQFPEAKVAFESARDLDAHSPDAEINLGRLAHDSPSAEAHFQRALTIAPGEPRALYQLSRLAWQRGDRTLARQYLETVRENAPGSRIIESAIQKLDRGDSSPYSVSSSSSLSGEESFR